MEINRYQTRKPKRLAVVTMGVKLGDETRGYTRFRFLSELLAREGFEVDLITSSFQHWDKAHRDTSKACYRNLPYNVVFIDEPGYTKNLDLTRIRSHRVAAKNLREHFERTAGTYDLVYAEIPPNDVARVCAEEADKQGIPFVADINDLWPEAMRMVVDVPVVSDVAFYPFSRDAKRVYQLLSAAVGTSDEYAARPAKDRARPYPKATVYVGNDLAAFDEGARINAPAVRKPEGELWVVYAGTLGASYDVATLEAAALLERGRLVRAASRRRTAASLPPRAREGAGRWSRSRELEALAVQLNAPVDFSGLHGLRADGGVLVRIDITVNSLVKSAAQSIVTKIGDYWPAESHDQHRLEPRVPREGDRRRLRSERRSEDAQAWPTPSRSSQVTRRCARSWARRRVPSPKRSSTNPARTARSWICCARCCDFCRTTRQKRAERVKNRELAYADCVRSRRSHAVYRVPRSNRD